MKKLILSVLIVITGLAVVSAALFTAVFSHELRSLSTFKLTDNGVTYSMTYSGDYWFDEFMETGAESPKELADFVISRMTRGLPVPLPEPKTDFHCSSFICHNDRGEVIFGRNFDYSYAPSLVVKTSPSTGYSAIAVSDMNFAGFDKQNLPKRDGISLESIGMLSAPYLAIDGMNEKGVAVSIMSVPIADAPIIEGAPWINTNTLVRMVIDKAASVDEAVELISRYNIWWNGDCCHFLIGDASGDSAVIEYQDGRMHVVRSDTGYQISTNFLQYGDKKTGNGVGRYQKIEDALENGNGVLTDSAALELLGDVGVYGRTQWSVVYNLTTGDVTLMPNLDFDKVEHFSLETSHDYK